jgi:hypothetical protein
MRDRQTCVDCGRKSPQTETNYTLISSRFGWRLLHYALPNGTIAVEWRCPACWREYKRARGLDMTSSRPPPEEPARPRAETGSWPPPAQAQRPSYPPLPPVNPPPRKK